MAGAFLESNLGGDIKVDCPISFQELRGSIRGYQERMLCFKAANIPNTFIDYVERDNAVVLLGRALILTAYGGVHLGALSITFPTPVERLLWKSAYYTILGVAAANGGVFLI